MVAHKRMRSTIHSPRVLLMECSVEFQRPEEKLVAFDVLQLQEAQFLRILVDRIAVLGPDVLVTSHTVAGLALEYLLQANITVVTRVPHKTLHRLARFVDAPIVSRLADIPSARLGYGCGWLHFSDPYLLFDHCPVQLGGTILLSKRYYQWKQGESIGEELVCLFVYRENS
jgi:chaperonin GroEL (HSP60 family)